jgi:hypothetical protein
MARRRHRRIDVGGGTGIVGSTLAVAPGSSDRRSESSCHGHRRTDDPVVLPRSSSDRRSGRPAALIVGSTLAGATVVVDPM